MRVTREDLTAYQASVDFWDDHVIIPSVRVSYRHPSKPPEKAAECNVPHVLRLPPTFEFDVYFSNSLIHYQVKAKEMATVKEVWTPSLNKHRF